MDIQKAKEILEKEGYEVKLKQQKYIDFPKLKLRLYTEVHKAETFKEVEKLISNKKRIPYLWELFYILEEEKIREMLNPNKEWLFFWAKRNKFDIKRKDLSGLYLYGDWDLYSISDILVSSYSNGQVVLVEELK